MLYSYQKMSKKVSKLARVCLCVCVYVCFRLLNFTNIHSLVVQFHIWYALQCICVYEFLKTKSMHILSFMIDFVITKLKITFQISKKAYFHEHFSLWIHEIIAILMRYSLTLIFASHSMRLTSKFFFFRIYKSVVELL